VTWTGNAKPTATAAREICGNGPGGAVTVSDTGMLTGEPVTPVEVIVTVPLYVPAPNPEVSTLTDTVDGASPLAGIAESQVALSDAAQESVPPPAFVTDIDREAGLTPPAWPVNARLPGVTDNAGAGVEAVEELPPHPARTRNARTAIGFRNPARMRAPPACSEKTAPDPIGPPASETPNRI